MANPFANLSKLVNTSTRSQDPATDFIAMFNKTVSRIADENLRQPSQTFKPSSLGGCIRKIFFEVTGAPIDARSSVDASLAGMGESGTDRHVRIQETIMRMVDFGFECEWIPVDDYLAAHPQLGTIVRERKGHEVKLFNTVLNLSFMCDGIIKFRGVYYILEIKTEASFKWQGRTAPAPKHTYQGASYSAALGIDKVMFMYENRDTTAKRGFAVEFSEVEKDEKVYGTIQAVNNYIAENKVPPMQKEAGDCTYCDFKGECKIWL